MTPEGLFERLAALLPFKGPTVREAYQAFVALLKADRLCLEEMAELEEALSRGSFRLSFETTRQLVRRLPLRARALVAQLDVLAPGGHAPLYALAERLGRELDALYAAPAGEAGPPYAVGLADKALSPALAGDKAWRLGHALAAGYPVPQGFVMTVNACRAFMQENALQPEVDGLLTGVAPDDLERLEAACAAARRLVREAGVPAQVLEALSAGAADLAPDGRPGHTLAVRSSALGEDTWAGFAGQYRSVLDVAEAELPEAYKRVLAGKYLPRAQALRMRMGLADQEVPMAVLVMRMAHGVCGGVAYSQDPAARLGREVVRVFSAPVSARGVVDGAMIPQIATFSRDWPPVPIDPGPKHACAPAARQELRPPSPQAFAAARMALSLERLHGAPQDTEWSGQADGTVWLLQTRDLARAADPDAGPAGAPAPDGSGASGGACPAAKASDAAPGRTTAPRGPAGGPGAQRDPDAGPAGALPPPPPGHGPSDSFAPSGFSVPSVTPDPPATPGPASPAGEAAPLYVGGLQASPGRASGSAFHLHRVADVAKVPEGAILFAASLWPEITLVLGRVRGVVSETGSQAGHLASVARSLGVPLLAAATGSMARVPSKTPVTLDTGERSIRKTQDASARPDAAPPPAASLAAPAAVARWKAALALVTPLGLTRPDDDGFTPKAARTLHDLVRYCHEMAVRAMFRLGEKKGRASGARRAALDAPLDLAVVDLGGGLVPQAGEDAQAPVGPAGFGTLLRALRHGLEHPRASWGEAASHFDWSKLSLSLEGGIVAASEARISAYAIASESHLHLLTRFGFHFAVLDCHVGQISDESYVNFSFKGGGGSKAGRMARLGLLSWLLEGQGFTVTVKADMLTAALPRPNRDKALRTLALLGFVLARTSFLDMAKDEAALDRAASDMADVAASLEQAATADIIATDRQERTKPQP